MRYPSTFDVFKPSHLIRTMFGPSSGVCTGHKWPA